MGKDYAKRRKGDTGRDGGGFVALPWSVLDCPAYARLSHPARSLLMEFARQLGKDNNGRLLASGAYLSKRGWKSDDVIDRAKKDLLANGFIFQTVQGQRPNKASWFAVTWFTLESNPSYDPGVTATFERGAYRKAEPEKITGLTPSGGASMALIAPSGGVKTTRPTPSNGAIKANFATFPTPSGGDLLEKPSA